MKVRLEQGEVERRRVRRGLLKCELAEAANISPNSVTLATRGREVGLRVARAVAGALGCSVGDLMDGKDM